MKKFFILPLIVLLFAGCVSVQNISDDQQKMAKEQAMGEAMLEAFKKQNYDGTVSLDSDKLYRRY